MNKADLYLKVLQDVSDRLNSSVEQYDKSKDGEQLRAAIVTILKGESKQ